MSLTMILGVVVLLMSMLQSGMSQPLSLSETDIQELVDAHNLFRGMVDPPASNMQRVQWNEELARVAQEYAEMCQFRDNPNRADNVSFPTVGENLAASNTRTPNYTEFVERSWFSRSVNYDYQTNMCSSPGSCTDYVQLAGANSTELGCGVARCSVIDGFPLPNSILLVCNYAPEADLAQGQPYLTGEPCSQCREEQNVCIMNSCSSMSFTDTLPTTITTTSGPLPHVTTTTDEEDASSQSRSTNRSSRSSSSTRSTNNEEDTSIASRSGSTNRSSSSRSSSTRSTTEEEDSSITENSRSGSTHRSSSSRSSTSTRVRSSRAKTQRSK